MGLAKDRQSNENSLPQTPLYMFSPTDEQLWKDPLAQQGFPFSL